MDHAAEIQSIATRAEEMLSSGCSIEHAVSTTTREMLDLVDRLPDPRRMVAGLDQKFFTPFNLARIDVNALRRLCHYVHMRGRNILRTYGFILERPDLFSRRVRVATWIEYMPCSVHGFGWTQDYCALVWSLKVPGSELMRYRSWKLATRGVEYSKVPPRIMEVICNDSVAQFEIMRSLGAVRVTKRLVMACLLKSECNSMAEHLVNTSPEVFKVWPAHEVLFFLCAFRSEVGVAKSVRLVRALARRAPGALRMTDPEGLTALDYTLFSMTYREDSRELASCLIELGISPDHGNVFGISWRDVVDVCGIGHSELEPSVAE